MEPTDSPSTPQPARGAPSGVRVDVRRVLAPATTAALGRLAGRCQVTTPTGAAVFHVLAHADSPQADSADGRPGNQTVEQLVGHASAVPVLSTHESALPWSQWYDVPTGQLAEVANLFVDPLWRSRGVARTLTSVAVEVLEGRQLCPVAVVAVGNEASRRALVAAGFVEVHVGPDPSGRPHRYLALPR